MMSDSPILSSASIQRRTITMVFNINDMAAFERDHPNICALAMADYDPAAPYGVTGLSTGDEVRRARMIGEAIDLSRDRHEAIDTITEILNLYEPLEFDAFDWGELKPAVAVEDKTGADAR